MGNRATLFRFHVELSDIDRGVYESLDFRAAQHPSETARFMMVRAMAYCLSYQEGIEFAPGGISDTEEPAIRVKTLDGRTLEWIEVGVPSARKLNKATKSANVVKVYIHRDASHLLKELARDEVHRADEIELYSFPNDFLKEIEGSLEKDNRWSLIRTDGVITLTIGSINAQCELERLVVGPV